MYMCVCMCTCDVNEKLLLCVNDFAHVHVHFDIFSLAIFGEGVGFGGVFRCSANLRDKYGESSHTCTCTLQFIADCTFIYSVRIFRLE